MLDKFLNSNEWQWRLARTILQGLIGVLIANIDLIVGYVVLDPAQRALIVAFVMAALSPIFKALGDAIEDAENQEIIDAAELLDDIIEEDAAHGTHE